MGSNGKSNEKSNGSNEKSGRVSDAGSCRQEDGAGPALLKRLLCKIQAIYRAPMCADYGKSR